MPDIKLDIKDEMDNLREVLNCLMLSEDNNIESILQVSQELDKVILKYIKWKITI